MPKVNITVNIRRDLGWQSANNGVVGRELTADAARFWSYVNRTNSCWLWTGTRGKSSLRYGQFGYRIEPRKQRTTSAHRFAWTLANGPIPPGAHVLHRCDNPICVNPDHLFLGDQDANMKDAAAKGRLHAPRPNRRKLTDADVAEILRLSQSGVKGVALAERFGVTKACISQLINGARRYVPAPKRSVA